MTHGESTKPTSRLKDDGSTCTGRLIPLATRAYFLLSAKRDAAAAERFLRKTLRTAHTQTPRVFNRPLAELKDFS